tara:strand:+ start:288 stop:491 length:204 start_codon:yes stop_codon:yes gene_type:complete
MKVEQSDNEIIFRLPITSEVEELQDMLELLEFLEITARSKASEKQVDQLVEEVKIGRWERSKAERGL